jgi:hypothetical protein
MSIRLIAVFKVRRATRFIGGIRAIKVVDEIVPASKQRPTAAGCWE